jgi:O-antigen ligase
MLGLSIDESRSMYFFMTMIWNLVISIVVINTIGTDCNSIEKVMKAIIFSSFITCLYIILIDKSNLLSGELGKGVIKPFFNDNYSHNEVSIAAGFSTLFLTYFSIKKEKVHFSLFLKIFFSIFIVLTGARKSLVLLLFALIIYPYIFSYKENKNYKKIYKIIIGLILLFIAVLLIMKNETLYKLIGYRFEGYFNGVLHGNYTESSANTRSIMIDTAVSLIRKNPLFGYGLNTFNLFKGSFGGWSHNNYLELCVSGGLIAPLLFYSFHFVSIVKLRKAKKNEMTGLFISLIIFLFIHDYLSVSYNNRLIILLLCLLDSYLCSQNGDEKNEKSIICDS